MRSGQRYVLMPKFLTVVEFVYIGNNVWFTDKFLCYADGMQIIPAIVGETFAEVKEKLEKVKGLVEWVQIDVVDGTFAEPASWGSHIGDNLHLWEPLELPKIEMHLMVQNPSVWLDDWASTSVDRIVMHAESDGDKKALIERLKKLGTQIGMALKLETPIDVLEPYAKDLDVVELMSIETIGSYGALFSEKVFEKISVVRNKYPNVIIEVDGGVNMDNARKLIDAGVNNLVVGSAIWKAGDITSTINEFKKI